ncbi:TonB-dependent receptor [Flavobacterium noncentrifugens]|uniref:Outer membrane protein beta-barrel family protein n=1 Tax=Flavobacterium noncentrifugens TaxID=1128970 RepID=A0A1G9B259_9FLAO|nr:carboxypeptidase-like regulatory domain-containing protein [Flavobacterium noncentrifugens]GEP51663.1 TonB-dependent receptor [Flavobacterium noncentrifugens]SDK33184.1 Outer membrane protein beta-barrel family protein [Flavobacterium noncentrifugens]
MKNFLLFALLFITAFSFSQNVKLDGLILDNSDKPLEMANVMAIHSGTNAMDSYAITNDKGKYQLTLKPNATYTVKVSYLGMQSKDVTITTSTQNASQNIKLEAGGIELQGVEVVREMPVSIKGDTIVYNADSFKSGTERKLEDVLKKLPGVEVNADGEIEVEGKKVQKLMVEGKDFFDGDTKLGVKNIPADAIDKIQVLRNYNEVSALKGLENNEENVAMNIKLKKGKKNFWFGDMTAGIGVGHEDRRYVINPKLFYYSPEYSINLIGNFNNIGELPFTPQDYFKFTGGFKSLMKKGGTGFNVSSNDLGLTLLRNNRAKEIETQFGATNFAYNVNKAWSLSGFAIVSSTLTELETKSQTTRSDLLNGIGNQQNTETKINTDEATNQKSNLALVKLSSSYKPNTKLQFDYDALFKKSSQNEYSNLFTQTTASALSDSQTVNTLKKQDPISLNQNVNLYYTQSDKNVFAFEMQHLFQQEDPFYNANLGRNPFPDSLLPQNQGDDLGIADQSRYDLNQNRFVKTNKVDSKFDYYYMLTPKSNINVTLGNTYSYQNFDSDIFQILDNNSVNDLNPNTDNDVAYSFNDVFLGLHYKFITGKFTINPGFSVHRYNTFNNQLESKASDDFYRFLPDVYAIYQLKKSESLTYNYAMTTDFTDINKLAEGYVMNGYNSLFKGNRYLENALVQTHSLRYFKYNMFNFTNIFGFVNYSRRMDAVKNKAKFIGINQSSEPYNSNFADEMLTGVGNYGRSFGDYKASVNANVNWSKFNNIRITPITNLEIPETTESFTQSYTAKLATNYKDFPNIEVGYNIAINHYQQNTFYTEKPSVKLDYYFMDAFSFVSEYEYFHYTSKDDTINNEYDFLSASLIYQKKSSKWEYKVSATNLLNTTTLNDDSFTQFSTRTSQYQVQPRYVIFSLKYNL